ncbi:protein phosphatase 1H-like [Pleurodeles waltl]
MISKVKSAVANFMGGSSTSSSQNHTLGTRPVAPPRPGTEVLPVKFPFERPSFLELTPEELHRSADHIHRPVLTPPKRLLWRTGYAEVINSGKSQNNEDQACCEIVNVERRTSNSHRNSLSSTDDEEVVCNTYTPENKEKDRICFHYWGLFDGHAGPGAAIMASKLLHLQICEQLRDIIDILQNTSMPPPICLSSELKTQAVQQVEDAPTEEDRVLTNDPTCRFHQEKQVSHQSLIVGAIENAFKQMDEHIERERSKYSVLGGCCAMAVVCLLGKLYVANAGDSRAIIICNGKIIPMSREFTPETERQRIQFVGFLKPELLGNEFTYLEFPRRIQYKELGRRMLFRDHTMTGWAYKTIEENDLKFPLIYGEGKKARVMATIGVTRGLGDHDLKVYGSNIHIKPFLSCFPEVRVYDLMQHEHCPDDVMVLGTDGLWDVTNNKEVADVVVNVLSNYEPDNPKRFTMVAQELVLRSRGALKERGWRLANEKLGSGDDISVFVIPLGGGTYT